MKNKLKFYHIFLFAGLVFSLYRICILYQWVEKITDDEDIKLAQDILVKPSVCTYNTGVFLAHGISKTDIIPIEDAYPGDIGFPLIANIITSLGFKKSPLCNSDLVRVIIWLNWIGLLFLVFALITANFRWTSIITMFVGTYYFMQIKELHAHWHSAFLGTFCLALAGMIFFALAFKKSYLNRLVLFSLAFFSLIWAYLIREPLGLIGIAGTISVLIMNFIREKIKWFHKILKYSGMVLLIYGITLVPFVLLTIRTLIWNIPKGKGYPKHAISHSLVIGLGLPTTPNSFGITRSDLTGEAIVSNVDHSIVKYSNKYYNILWNIYLKMVAKQPLEIINIYWQNTLATLDCPTYLLNYKFYIIISMFLIILFICLMRQYLISFQIVIAIVISSIIALTQGVLSSIFFVKIAEIGFIIGILGLFEISAQIIQNKWRGNVYKI